MFSCCIYKFYCLFTTYMLNYLFNLKNINFFVFLYFDIFFVIFLEKCFVLEK
jgi:hypothetical protein